MQTPPPNPDRDSPPSQPPNTHSLPPYPPPPYPLYPPPPYPPYSQPFPPYPPPYPFYPPPPYPQGRDNTTALVMEMVCAILGVYGIGWLIGRRIVAGIAILIGGLVWTFVAIVAILGTLGLAMFIVLPLHTVFIICDVLLLDKSLR